MTVFEIILVAFFSPLAFHLVFSPFYLVFGLNKWYYHNLLGWHQPKDDACVIFDGCSLHCVCKHCGKEIMQDSQGNWF